jgi:glycosyltransferase involved in cell wall biosynthesis
MRVLFVNQKARFAGGAEQYVADTATALRQHGVESFLLYGVEGWAAPEFTALFQGAFPMVALERQIRDLAPDIVYVHQLDDALAMRDIRRAGFPVVRFFHDHRLFCPREHKYTTIGQQTCTRTVGIGCFGCLGVLTRSAGPLGVRLRTVASVRAEQAASRGIDACVVGSTYMADHLVAHGFDPGTVHVNPLFPRSLAGDGAAPERDPSLLLFVGALVRGKGLDVLLRALALLPAHVRLVVAGEGPQDESSLASRLGIGHRVDYAGRLGADDLGDCYRRAACVVVPSRSPETFGLVGLEAQAAATPVVATDVGGVREWLRDGDTGRLASTGNPESLAEAIAWVLDHPEEAAAMGQRGRESCRTRFTAAGHTERLVRLFRSLAPHPVLRLVTSGTA